MRALLDLLKASQSSEILQSGARCLRSLYVTEGNLPLIRVENKGRINDIIQVMYDHRTNLPVITTLRQVIVKYLSENDDFKGDLDLKAKEHLIAMRMIRNGKGDLYTTP